MAKFKSEIIERSVPQKLKIIRMPGFRLIEGTILRKKGVSIQFLSQELSAI